MDQRSIYRQALFYAAETLGGAGRLASFFNVPPEKLSAWLSGEQLPPLEIFLDSLDIISQGPYAPRRRPIRVAALREGDETPQASAPTTS
jgi:hypothetical protein